jgi:hypothetical protein
MKAGTIIAVVVAIVLVAGAGFGGYVYGVSQGKAQANSVREQFIRERFGQGTPGAQGGQVVTGGQGAQGGQNGQFPAAGTFIGRGNVGTIKSITGNTVVISTAEKELSVEVSDQTRITTSAQVKVSDLKVGDRIVVAGQTTGDKVTANSIQVMNDLSQP